MTKSRDEEDADRLDHIHWLTLALRLPDEEIETRFKSDEAARARLVEIRWPEGPTCPSCGSGEVIALSTRPVFKCRTCKHQFSETSGTRLHASRISPLLWFGAAAKVIRFRSTSSARYQLPSQTLAALLGTHYAAAWKARIILLEDLARGGSGLLREAVCVNVVEVPEDIKVGGEEHEEWLLDMRWPIYVPDW